ncbi:MAG: hypothetical protein A2498_11565 [Lentisphaerae bacterium RIFOXYC12_FULL_60_16]|nr:MAG: hypothetical protein A2498_11565 [Lentisphaerae bacterium RIFOXYC12_FULL_60_16]OGV74738.1 MAG: hypothetical protein A2269_06160 [Lentisphaerae bacterium RIFOXYA12_FULL_60_10]OGV85868.1 MAG: hypothetical protein A2340_11335 [Lentisphaerae bacterium RIFOXYB12_FULL_60_10]
MAKPFRIGVFGKKGCDKCAVLMDRLGRLLEKPEWNDFEIQYVDVESEDGLVQFAEAECINPQRIPAMIVFRQEGGDYVPVPNAQPGAADLVCGKSRLFQYLGLQTDYSDEGKGVLTPKMIRFVLDAVRG